jgi:carboxymethylenebutenolidase
MTPQMMSQLWDEHTSHEFATRDTEHTLATMVEDAQVNHVPVMTGGRGKPALREFYSKDFIPCMPPDTTLTPVSRTVGAALKETQHDAQSSSTGLCYGAVS